MSDVLIAQTTMENIADAIRSKNGLSNTYKPAQMPAAISNLSPAPSLQSKSVNYTPTESAQSATVTADSGYDGLSSVGVSVGAISSTYVGSGIDRQTESTVKDGLLDFLDDESYIIIPEGYYADQIDIELNNVSPPNPTITVSNSGLITASYDIDSGYLNTNNASLTYSATQQLTTKAATTYTPSSSFQTIAAGQYLTGAQTIAALNNQNKSVTPTESLQSVTADSGYTGLGTVSVDAISSTYVGSGITQRSSSDLTASGATVTVPAGYYASQASKSVTTMTLPTSAASSVTSGYTSKATIGRSTSAQYINIPPGYNSAGGYYTISATPNGTVTAPSSISGTSATVSTGTNTITLTKTVSVTPNVSTAGYISSGTAGNSSVSLTASVTTKAAATITPTTTNQTIASGTYLTGTQTIAGDADLIGSNIISTANIFNVQGTVVINKYYTGSSAPSSSLGNNGDIYLQS